MSPPGPTGTDSWAPFTIRFLRELFGLTSSILSMSTSAALAKGCRSKDVLAVLGDRDDEDVLAAAIGDWDSVSRVYLLSYLAARPEDRGQGIGSTLMGYLPPAVASSAGAADRRRSRRSKGVPGVEHG